MTPFGLRLRQRTLEREHGGDFRIDGKMPRRLLVAEKAGKQRMIKGRYGHDLPGQLSKKTVSFSPCRWTSNVSAALRAAISVATRTRCSTRARTGSSALALPRRKNTAVCGDRY